MGYERPRRSDDNDKHKSSKALGIQCAEYEYIVIRVTRRREERKTRTCTSRVLWCMCVVHASRSAINEPKKEEILEGLFIFAVSHSCVPHVRKCWAVRLPLWNGDVTTRTSLMDRCKCSCPLLSFDGTHTYTHAWIEEHTNAFSFPTSKKLDGWFCAWIEMDIILRVAWLDCWPSLNAAAHTSARTHSIYYLYNYLNEPIASSLALGNADNDSANARWTCWKDNKWTVFILSPLFSLLSNRCPRTTYNSSIFSASLMTSMCLEWPLDLYRGKTDVECAVEKDCIETI